MPSNPNDLWGWHSDFNANNRVSYVNVSYAPQDSPETTFFFEGLNQHISNCKIFNGFSILQRENSRSSDDRILRCCCGQEWGITPEMWRYKYGRMHFDDVIMDLNYRNLNVSRNRPMQETKKQSKEVEICHKKDVENAIEGLEI